MVWTVGEGAWRRKCIDIFVGGFKSRLLLLPSSSRAFCLGFSHSDTLLRRDSRVQPSNSKTHSLSPSRPPSLINTGHSHLPTSSLLGPWLLQAVESVPEQHKGASLLRPRPFAFNLGTRLLSLGLSIPRGEPFFH